MRLPAAPVLALMLALAPLGVRWTCAQSVPRPPLTLSDAAPIHEVNGLDIAPPAGQGWIKGGYLSDGAHVRFFKATGETVFWASAAVQFTQGTIRNADGIVAHLKQQIGEFPPDFRVRASFTKDPAPGPTCVRVDANGENRRREGVIFDFDFHGRHCIHPRAPDVLVALEYYRGARRGDAQAGERDEGDAFIRRVKFVGVQRPIDQLQRLAQANDVGAQYQLAMLYQRGDQVPQDDRQAVLWLGRAAERGDAPSKNALAWHFRFGRGVAADLSKAVELYREAAEQGEEWAQLNLGLMYSDGVGVPRHDAVAISWFKRSAEQGNAAAQDMLGAAYLDGVGVERNESEAHKWLVSAAIQGEPLAQHYVGTSYLFGRLVERNESEAARWIGKAADSGYAVAQFELSTLYAAGTGVGRDATLSYMWCTLAAAQASSHQAQYASACADLAERLTAEQLADARARIKNRDGAPERPRLP